MKRCIVYGAVWVILCGSYIYTAGYGIFVVLTIMAVLPLLSAGYALFIRDKLYIEIKNSQDVLIRGEKLGYDIIVKNSALFVVSDINLVVNYSYSNCDFVSYKTYVISVNGTEKEIVRVDEKMEYVGVIKLDTDKSYIQDPLKLFRFSIKHCDQCEVTIMPVLNEPDYYSFYSMSVSDFDSVEYSKKRKGEDTSQIFDIRNYANGDSLNRVHWKLSAKEDELLVKEFSHPITKDNCILLEIHKFANDNERCNLNGVFEMAYAIGNLACAKEKEISFVFYSEKNKELRCIDVLSADELVEAVRIMIQELTYEGNKALKHYLESGMVQEKKLYYITDRYDEEVLAIEECIDATAFIYCVNDSDESGKVTKLIRNTLIEVDRDDIKWGLSNTII